MNQRPPMIITDATKSNWVDMRGVGGGGGGGALNGKFFSLQIAM